jgi:putative transposase
MEKHLRYKYRIYPNKAQEQLLKQACGTTRYIWNHYLNENILHHQKTGKFIFYNDMCAMLTQLKKTFPWMKNTNAQVLQQKLKDLDTALKNCFKHKRGFPKFKKKSNFSDAIRYMQGLKFEKTKYTYQR